MLFHGDGGGAGVMPDPQGIVRDCAAWPDWRVPRARITQIMNLINQSP